MQCSGELVPVIFNPIGTLALQRPAQIQSGQAPAEVLARLTERVRRELGAVQEDELLQAGAPPL